MIRPITISAVILLSAGVLAADDLLLADFEGETYGAWQATGEAFGKGPARGTLPRQGRVTGFLGKGLVNTYLNGDGATGTLTGPEFKVERKFINFLIGGGNWPGLTCANLLVDGQVVRTRAGTDDDALTWVTWDVADFSGKTARLQLVDKHSGLFGHVMADQIVHSNRAKSPEIVGDREPGRQMARAAMEKFGVQDIIFATRQEEPDGHWYANFSYWSNSPNRRMYHDGGSLRRLNLKTGEVTKLIDEPTGGVRDPQLHYDGQRILFSYRKGGQPFYHLYEMNVDGTGLRQITDGPFDDIEPTYLPDGGIVFCSTRCNRMVNCYYVRVAIVHRCDADGSNIRPLSCNIEQDNTPWPLPDGRVIYQRWEYIDRSQVSYHHLWTMNPDGTNQMVYYGNLHPGVVMIDAKPIPNTQKVVASFSPGHGRREHAGVVTIVDPGLGPDERQFARSISKGRYYRDPYPFSEDCFLLAGSTDILVMDGQGQTGVLYDLPEADKLAGLRLHEPGPVLPKPRERVIPPAST